MRLYSVNNLSTLREISERLLVDDYGAKLFHKHLEASKVMQRCEEHSSYSELVSFFSDVHVRLARLELPQLRTTLGLKYAALDLAMPAFQEFLRIRQSLNGPPLKFPSSASVIHALHESTESVLFARPDYDTAFILSTLTSEGDYSLSKGINFHEILHASPDGDWSTWSAYLCLLAKLHSRDALCSSWRQYLSIYTKDSENSCHHAYDLIVALVRARRSEEAALFLEQIAQRSEDNLPFFSTFADVQVLLGDPIVSEAIPDLIQGREYEGLLETYLEDVESRLGITWKHVEQQSEVKVHVSVAPDSPWTVFRDQPLFTIDGESAGYEHWARIWSVIQSLGCSKSLNDLEKIVDVLNEQDGCPQQVVVQPSSSTMHNTLKPIPASTEFQWNPEQAPLEISERPFPSFSDRPPASTPALFGLLRARAVVKGVPQDNNKCLHLLQLGSLYMRADQQSPWQQSGYIVAWDRQLGGMIALYVGRAFGVVDRGQTPLSAPLGSILHIEPAHAPSRKQRCSGRQSRISDYASSYYLDLDSSPNLEYQKKM